MARLVIGGVTSGVGKTTLTAGIIAALRRRGRRVAPFKVGPDYIDPGYHARAAGAPARNLDGWLVPPAALRALFARAAADADVAVIEGVMGLFDGRADGAEGSTAALARLLDAPVALVVDVGKVSRTAAAIVLGCQRFDPAVRLGGVLLNRVGSARHLAWTSGPIATTTNLPTLGHMPTRADLALPERHLGLPPTAEGMVDDGFFARLADQVEESVDVDALVALAGTAPPLAADAPDGLFPATPVPPRARIAVARDEAFNFYYEDNLDLLRAWGAELVPFSPLRDPALPPGVGGVYLGGGFPELYAPALAANAPLRAHLRRAASAGAVVYAECGGLMYAGEGITDPAGARHEMVGLVPGWSMLDGTRRTIGYRTATARRDTFLLRAGERVRGHEFHWSRLAGGCVSEAAYDLDETGAAEGVARGSVLASYLHLHFATDPRLAPRFVEACAAVAPIAQRGGAAWTG